MPSENTISAGKKALLPVRRPSDSSDIIGLISASEKLISPWPGPPCRLITSLLGGALAITLLVKTALRIS